MTITLKETNDFPPQVVPISGSVCKEGPPEASGLVVTAVDQDFPPHAAPFIFEIPDELSVNWTLSQLNSTRGNSGEVKARVAPLNLTRFSISTLQPLTPSSIRWWCWRQGSMRFRCWCQTPAGRLSALSVTSTSPCARAIPPETASQRRELC